MILSLFYRSDTEAEHQLVKQAAVAAGASSAVVCSHWGEGGKGAAALADAVMQACQTPHNFQ